MWVRLDDGFPEHPRIAPLSDRAFRLHVTGMCHAARYLTDGWVPGQPPSARRIVAELERAGLWAPAADGGWMIRDWSQWNPSGERLKERRAADAERKRRERRRRNDYGDEPEEP